LEKCIAIESPETLLAVMRVMVAMVAESGESESVVPVLRFIEYVQSKEETGKEGERAIDVLRGAIDPQLFTAAGTGIPEEEAGRDGKSD
jgi:hypothetical protein